MAKYDFPVQKKMSNLINLSDIVNYGRPCVVINEIVIVYYQCNIDLAFKVAALSLEAKKNNYYFWYTPADSGGSVYMGGQNYLFAKYALYKHAFEL